MQTTDAKIASQMTGYVDVSRQASQFGFALPFYLSQRLFDDTVEFNYTLLTTTAFTRAGHLAALLESATFQIYALSKYRLGQFTRECFDLQGNRTTRQFSLSITLTDGGRLVFLLKDRE